MRPGRMHNFLPFPKEGMAKAGDAGDEAEGLEAEKAGRVAGTVQEEVGRSSLRVFGAPRTV